MIRQIYQTVADYLSAFSIPSATILSYQLFVSSPFVTKALRILDERLFNSANKKPEKLKSNFSRSMKPETRPTYPAAQGRTRRLIQI